MYPATPWSVPGCEPDNCGCGGRRDPLVDTQHHGTQAVRAHLSTARQIVRAGNMAGGYHALRPQTEDTGRPASGHVQH